MSKSTKPRLLSGIKPTGTVHLGNYFGAMRQFVELQDQYDSYIMLADYHALTTVQEAATLRAHTLNLVLDYLGAGLDPEKVVLFKQSAVPEHTELAWIFDCLTSLPYLKRAHAYKDAIARGKEEEVSAGLFTYPLLMAADILLYEPAVVPVGQDQKQHLEITRDVALKFNQTFGQTFPLPEPLILEEVQTVPGVDGRKMSKSYGNVIPLFAEDNEVRRAVMSIVTDSAGETPTNVYELHKLFRSPADLANLYAEKKGKYQELKEALAEDVIAFITPLRKRRAEFANEPERVAQILTEGAARARELASAKMAEVRHQVGVV